MVKAACATVVSRRLKVQVRPGYNELCNLWILVSLPSGNRKSSVQTDAIDPLVKWERDQTEDMEPKIKRITSKRKTAEDRIKKIRSDAVKEKDESKREKLEQEVEEIEAELPEIPSPPRLWTSDSTPERLGDLLADNGECIAWLSLEGGVFDLLQGRYSSGKLNLDLILKAHSGDADRVDWISWPSSSLRRPLLTVGLSPQPDVLRGLSARPEFRGRGLLGRFLYLLPPSLLGFRCLEDNPLPSHAKYDYHNGIRAMLDWPAAAPDKKGKENLYTVKLSKKAHKEWK